MASENLDPIVSVIKSFIRHPSKVKIKTKVLEPTLILEKPAAINLERLLVISTLSDYFI